MICCRVPPTAFYVDKVCRSCGKGIVKCSPCLPLKLTYIRPNGYNGALGTTYDRPWLVQTIFSRCRCISINSSSSSSSRSWRPGPDLENLRMRYHCLVRTERSILQLIPASEAIFPKNIMAPTCTMDLCYLGFMSRVHSTCSRLCAVRLRLPLRLALDRSRRQ
jgi:hypothetical protein